MRNASTILVQAGLLAGVLTACAHSATPKASTPPARDADVTSEDLRNSPARPIEQQLMAKVPGITVSRTSSGGVAIRIRGGGSLSGSNSPLYVIDGLAVDAGPEGEMPGIDPYDIQSIKVLKETEAMPLYGARGEHGVIIITTKRSNRAHR